MDKDYIDKYEILTDDDNFQITKEDLLNLVNPTNIHTMDSYHHLTQLWWS